MDQAVIPLESCHLLGHWQEGGHGLTGRGPVPHHLLSSLGILLLPFPISHFPLVPPSSLMPWMIPGTLLTKTRKGSWSNGKLSWLLRGSKRGKIQRTKKNSYFIFLFFYKVNKYLATIFPHSFTQTFSIYWIFPVLAAGIITNSSSRDLVVWEIVKGVIRVTVQYFKHTVRTL